ncbi:MAG: sodium/glutamate symporter [Planctomycetota bacterium]|nr:sodium/glutamate symporter [Planctomycetota bacterium]
MNAVVSFVGLCLLLWVGHFLRMRIRLLQRLFLPSSVIGGLIGLVVLQGFHWFGRPLPAGWTTGWSDLPGFLINIVFACLFLGVSLPSLRTLWRHAGPQLAYGQVVAWGQYVVGIGLVLVVLGPLFGVPDMFGGIVPVGFEGGHGTAAGLAQTFKDLDWAAGRDFALASATIGIISAIVIGMVLINWAARRGYTVRRTDPADMPEDDTIGVIPVDRRPSAGRLTVRSGAIEAFTLHVAIVGVAVGIGILIKQGFWQIEHAINAGLAEADRLKSNSYILVKSFPLFPLCMIGGLLVQVIEDKFDRHKLLDIGLTKRIQNTALDFLVVAAIATIRIETLSAYWVPFVVIASAGILWNVFCVLVLARRMLPDAWFERSIAEMGQSMGVTATGLLLLRVVDPDYKSPAADAFAYKQILHEPFMGGGLWTSTAIPLLALWGGWPVLGIAAAAVAAWLLIIFGSRALRRF